MSATITVLRPGNEDTVEMYVTPEEKIKDIIERCQSYWQLEGSCDKYGLMRNNTELLSHKTVISSDLQDNDVVRFFEKGSMEEGEKSEVDSLKPEEILSLAEKWLKDNIGVKRDNLKLLEKREREKETSLQFRNNERDEYYTILVKGKKVKTYIPALVE